MKNIQQTIQSLLDQSFTEKDGERGAQVAVYQHGKLVVNAFVGIADPATGRPVDEKTLFAAFSTGKGMAATLVHLLVERGQITYETPIASVWPEFATHGKDKITLRHALNHTAGLSQMPTGLGHAELCNWEKMCEKIADLTPLTPPGMTMAYHAITYSWLLGEVARRVDGRPFPQMLREEITIPLGIADDLFFGIPDEVESRVAILEAEVDPAAPVVLPHDATPQAIPALVQPLYQWMNRADARRACIPASNGIMTAHAIARHYAALLPGGVDGVELLPPSRILVATEPQLAGDHKPGDPVANHRLGYAMGQALSTSGFGHGGYGGSTGFADPIHGIAFGFTRNRFINNTTLTKVFESLQATLSS